MNARSLWLAIRSLAKSPGYPVCAILILSLAIGGTLGVFTIVDRVLAGQQLWRDPKTLAFLEKQAEGSNDRQPAWSYPGLRALQQAMPATVATVTGVSTIDVIAARSPADQAETLGIEAVAPNYFTVLGLPAAAGRLDVGQPDTDPLTAVISDRLWERYYRRDPAVVGKTLRANGVSLRIAGVAVAGFTGMTRTADLWVPASATPALLGDPSVIQDTYWAYRALVRLAPAPSTGRHSEALNAVSRSIGLTTAHTPSRLVAVSPASVLIQAKLRSTLATLLGAAVCMLLLACGTVAGLGVVRALARSGDTATRIALGAKRRDLLLLWGTEGVVIALLATVLGLMLSRWVIAALWVSRPSTASWNRVLATLDQPSFGATGIALACLSLLLATVALVAWPMRQVERLVGGTAALVVSQRHAGDDTGGRGSRTRFRLATLQVMLSFVLVQCALLLSSRTLQLNRERIGVTPADLSVGKVQLPKATSDPQSTALFFQNLQDRIAALPGVQAVSLDDALPLEGAADYTSATAANINGVRQTPQQIYYHRVGSDQWRALGVRIIAGRTIRASPGEKNIEAMVNRAAAQLLWPGASAVGQPVSVVLGDGGNSEARAATVVGVVDDIQYGPPGSALQPAIFVPIVAAPPRMAHILVRSKEPIDRLWPQVQGVARTLDPDAVVVKEGTMSEVLERARAGLRYTARVVALYAALAFLLAVVGIYGVISYDVNLRTREFGVMRALGASDRTVVAKVVRRGLNIAAWGVGVGILGSLASLKVLSSQIYNVADFGIWPIVVCVGLFACTAIVASVLPALRAIRVSPLAALNA